MSISRLMQMGAAAGVDTGAWNLSLAFYSGNSLSVAAQDTAPAKVFFKPDGLKMYVLGFTGTDVNEYDLSTAWDVSTASFLQNFDVSPQHNSPRGLFFKPDGTKMYVIGLNDDVSEYDLSTAWDVSSASYLQNFDVNPQEDAPQDVFFKPDGTKMYVLGEVGQDVNEYDLSTAWDVSSASFLQNFNVAAQDTIPLGMAFKPDGTKMYVIGKTTDNVNEYDLSTSWDVSTASFLQSFSISSQETEPRGVSFKPDGEKMFVVGVSTDTVYEYNFYSLNDVEVEYLVVGGGGGGGGSLGIFDGAIGGAGGGGAGGVTIGSTYINRGKSYTITVGNGGAGGTGRAQGSDGQSSSLDSLVSASGGGGGAADNASGSNGACGGGAGGTSETATGGSGTLGFDGGDSLSGTNNNGAGGGGMGAAGQDGGTTAGNFGDGGDGITSSITGSSVYYGGGGGGGEGADATNDQGDGGLGGGGRGGRIRRTDNNAVAGTANTGGGGGGGADDTGTEQNGAAGGSGVVILRSLETAASTTGSPTVTTDGSYTIYKFTSSGSITY